jgi:hypothetical protein
MGQSKPPGGVAKQRGAGICLEELNPNRDPAKVNFRLAAAVPPRAFASPNAAGPDGRSADFKFSPVQSQYYSLLFPAALRHIAGKQER